MNRLTELFLERRGYDRAFLSEIENDAHGVPADVDKLCERLYRAREDGELVVVLPDFDMDGIMAGVVLNAGLSELGFRVALFHPIPGEGYGFDEGTILRLYNQFPDAKVILTCDVGATCFSGIRKAKELGLDVLVTDHHGISSRGLPPDALVVVDPMRSDDPYEHPGICGAYVAYQCLQYFADRYHDCFMREQIARLRVFAGIGTVSDSMPVLYENRRLIRDAVAACRYIHAGGETTVVDDIPGHPTYRQAFIGLWILLTTFAEEGKFRSPDSLNETFFSFYVAPAFNAVKRLNADIGAAFGVFFNQSAVASKECVSQLLVFNEQRKSLVEDWMQTIQQSVDNGEQQYAPYIYVADVPSGLCGLLATKLMAASGLPTMVVAPTDGCFAGSGRSPDWYPMASGMGGVDGFHAAGHDCAFGCAFAEENDMLQLYLFLVGDMDRAMAEAGDTAGSSDLYIAPYADADCWLDVPLLREFAHDMDRLRPFGTSLPAPVVRMRIPVTVGTWTTLGANKQHLKILLPYGFSVLCWDQGQLAKLPAQEPETAVELIGTIELNRYMDQTNVQFSGRCVAC